jgi:protein-L-isoaspartate(D-aspartate) O-methyltransferase
MTDLPELTGKEKVLEIGTGSGYQAAVLSKLAKEVYTIEIVPELAEKAKKVLNKLKYKNVHIKVGSGEWGWPEKSPFDAIMITAGISDAVPKDLFDQLMPGGVLIAPVGSGNDKVMVRFRKGRSGNFSEEKFGIFHFVPFIKEKN